MATAAYDKWVAAGSPWREARPITETRAQARAAHPDAIIYVLGDDAHLKASTPLDHTPFPANPWPVALPGYVVCAVDYMHNRGGLDCHVLFPNLLALCKAGKRPWTKYFIWQARRYDVRNGWVPVAASDHFDHIHESFRSDWTDRSIGGYPNPFTQEDDDMDDKQKQQLADVHYTTTGIPTEDGPKVPLHTAMDRVLRALQEIQDQSVDPEAIGAALVAALAEHPELMGQLASLMPSAEQIATAVVDEDHKRSAE